MGDGKGLVLDQNNQMSLSENTVQEKKEEKQMVPVTMTEVNLVPKTMTTLLPGRGVCV